MRQSASSSLHLPSLAMFLISGLGLLLYLSAAVGLVFLALFALIMGASPDQQVLPMLSLAWITGFFGMLLLPSLGLSLSRLLNLRFSLHLAFPLVRKGGWLMLFWLLVIGLGAWVSRWDGAKWLVLPLLQVLAAVIPLWWLLSIGQRAIPQVLSAERQWGLVSFGLVLGMPLVIVVEVVMLGVVGVVALVWFSAQPELVSQLTAAMERLSEFSPQSLQQSELILDVLRPLLVQPAVVFVMMIVTVVIIPMVEELLKPAALLLFIRRELTPAAGFAGGLLCGATFALVETLGSLATPAGDSWSLLVLGRFGTGMLHTTTTALVGWALASVREQGGIWRLIQVYWIAVAFHGLWNVFGLLVGFVNILPSVAAESSFLSLALLLGRIAPLVLGFLMLVLLILLIGSSRKVAIQRALAESKQEIGL